MNDAFESLARSVVLLVWSCLAVMVAGAVLVLTGHVLRVLWGAL